MADKTIVPCHHRCLPPREAGWEGGGDGGVDEEGLREGRDALPDEKHDEAAALAALRHTANRLLLSRCEN